MENHDQGYSIGESINNLQQTIHETSVALAALRSRGRLNLPEGNNDPEVAEQARRRHEARSHLHYYVKINEEGKQRYEERTKQDRANALAAGNCIPVWTGRNHI